MVSNRRTTAGLSSRIVRLTIVLGMTIVLASSIMALVSTRQLTAERAFRRDRLTVQMFEVEIEDRLATAAGVLDRASMLVSQSESPQDAARGISALHMGSAVVKEISLVDYSGRALVVVSDSIERRSFTGEPVFRRALEGASGIIHVDEPEDRHQLWVVRTTLSPDGTPLFVLGRLDTGILENAIDRAAMVQDDRTVVLLEAGNVRFVTGGRAAPRLSTAIWSEETTGSGRVTVVMEDGARANGAYSDIEPAEGVSWRVMSVKDTALDIIETVRTVVPYLLVLVAGGGVAVVVAWAASYRIVRPLRELERTARNAALGAYVKPIAESGDDEIGRVAKAFNEVALRLNSLHDLSQLLASTSRLDQVLDGILAAVGHIVGPGTSAIYLLNTAEKRLDPVRVRGAGLANAQSVGLGDAVWLMEVLGGSEPEVLIGDSAVMQAELPGIEGSYRSALAAPLVAGNEVLGLVVILKDGNERVSEAEREMVRTFSAQASVAVQTSRLFEIETASRKVADALRVVAQELVRPEELEDSLAKVEDIVSELFSSTRTRVLIVNRKSLGLEPAQNPDLESETLGAAKAIFDEHGGSAVLLRRGECPSADVLMGESASALLAVPIGLDGDHGGALVVDLPAEGGREDAVEVGRALGDEISLALDNAYLYQRALLRAANLETIFRISQAVGSSLQVNVVLNRVLDVVQKILAADAVMLWSYDSRRRSLGTAMVRGAVPAGLLHLELAPGEDLPGSIFDSGEPLVLRGLATSMDGVAGSAAAQGMGSLLGVPLLARGRSIGVLMVLSTSDDSFSDESVNILQTFASQAALAIDTARLYSNEYEVAHVLQHAILPEALPDFPEVEGGSVYAPAGGAAEIGGDYYDLFRARDGLVWFIIADVCGKGVEAATKTSMIKYAVRAFVAAGMSPGRVLGEVNAMVSEAGLPSDIVTLWVGAYDAKNGKIRWANGGHPPGVLRRADGNVERLGVTGPLLGVTPDVEYDEQTLRIGRGDRILLFTDGVTEARSGNTFFGDERVERSLDLGGSAQEVAEGLLAEVRGFVRAELKDDVAILVLAVRGAAEISGRGKARG